MISSYVDEADVSSVLMPNESLTVDISRNKIDIVNESKSASFNVLPSLQKYPNLLTQDNTISKVNGGTKKSFVMSFFLIFLWNFKISVVRYFQTLS